MSAVLFLSGLENIKQLPSFWPLWFSKRNALSFQLFSSMGNVSFSSCYLWDFFGLNLVFKSLTRICLGVDFLVFLLLIFTQLLKSVSLSFAKFWKFELFFFLTFVLFLCFFWDSNRSFVIVSLFPEALVRLFFFFRWG